MDKVNNPFAVERKDAGSVVSQAESHREAKEVEAAVVMAKKFPRDECVAMDKIINACTRYGLAAKALYSYQRGGTEITGPSIRLAEAMAQSWGNLHCGVKEVGQVSGMSIMVAYAWDLESNFRDSKEFHVPHVRSTRQGNKQLKDSRDIYEMVANMGARRKRACILAMMPTDVVEQAVNQCYITMESKVDVSPESVKGWVEAFHRDYKVTPGMISKRIQRSIESINAPLLVRLQSIYNSMRDGMSKPSDWFDIEEPTTGDSANTVQAEEYDIACIKGLLKTPSVIAVKGLAEATLERISHGITKPDARGLYKELVGVIREAGAKPPAMPKKGKKKKAAPPKPAKVKPATERKEMSAADKRQALEDRVNSAGEQAYGHEWQSPAFVKQSVSEINEDCEEVGHLSNEELETLLENLKK